MLWTHCEILRGYFRNVLSPANAPLWQKNKGVSKIHLDPLRWFLMTTIFFKQYIHMYIVYDGVKFFPKSQLKFLYVTPTISWKIFQTIHVIHKVHIFWESGNQFDKIAQLIWILLSKRLMNCRILSYVICQAF